MFVCLILSKQVLIFDESHLWHLARRQLFCNSWDLVFTSPVFNQTVPQLSKKYSIAFNDIFRHWQKITSVPGKFHQLTLSQREAMEKMPFLTWNRRGESWNWKMLMIWDEKWQSTCKPSRNRINSLFYLFVEKNIMWATPECLKYLR